METLIEGAVLAVLVVLIFLRDLRATLIAAIALPLSVIPTFWAMDMLGFSLNLVSLLGITLVTGILVDDAIVEIENIVRHMQMGKSPYRAALEAADEIGLAVIAITLTIMAVFAPVSFMGGIAGQYFKQFGLTVAVAVFFSLLVARLITPMLAAYFLRATATCGAEAGPACMRGYTRLCAWSLRYRFADAARRRRAASPARSTQLRPAAVRASCPARTRPHRCSRRTAARARGWTTPRPSPTRSAASLRERPEVSSVFVDRRRQLPHGTQRGRARRRSSSTSCTRTSASVTQKQHRARDAAPTLATIPDIRVWFAQRQRRSAQLPARRHGHRRPPWLDERRGDRRARCGSCPCSQTSSRPPRSTGRRCASCRTRSSRPSSASPPTTHLRGACASPPSATSARTSPSSTSATGRSRSACSSTKARAAIRSSSRALKVADRARACPCRSSSVADVQLRPGPDRDRPLRPRAPRRRSAPTWRHDAARARPSHAVMALPAAKNAAGRRRDPGSPATPRSWARCSQGFATAMGAGLMMVLAVLVLLFGSFLQPITILFSLPLSIGGVIVGADRHQQADHPCRW